MSDNAEDRTDGTSGTGPRQRRQAVLGTVAGIGAFLVGFFLPIGSRFAKRVVAPDAAEASTGRDPRLEASEADLAENEPVTDEEEDEDGPVSSAPLPDEAPEADVLEQRRVEPLDDEEDRR